MKGLVVIFLISFFLTWIASQAREGNPTKAGDELRFPPVKTVYIVYMAALTLSCFLSVLALRGPRSDRMMILSGSVGLAVLAVLSWPKTIHIDQSGISQRFWLGGWKSISWKTVIKVKKLRDGSIAVTDGSRIIALSQYDVGHDAFLEQMQNMANIR